MAHIWFYADRHNQQQGPVDQSWLVNAAQRGELSPSTLVWREGLPAWVPLSQVGADLGIAMPKAPPALAPVRRAPVIQPGRSSSWVVVVIVLIFGFVVVAGIFAAIAIPAYQDYTLRAKVAEARMHGAKLKMPVAEYFAEKGSCPSNGDGDFKRVEDYATPLVTWIYLGSTEDGRCTIQVSLNEFGMRVENPEIVLALNGDGSWTETSNLPDRYLPMSMRQASQR